VVFDSPGFVRARDEVARLLAARGAPGGFDPAALKPVLPIASTEPDFDRWMWPLRVDTAECQAPLEALS
jgi:hypothetical protein